MPDHRLANARAELPADYQFGQAAHTHRWAFEATSAVMRCVRCGVIRPVPHEPLEPSDESLWGV